MERVIEPDWLDELPAEAPRAIHSRGDLRRLNWFMNHAGIIARELRSLPVPERVLDVGSGDGALALSVAKQVGWRGVEFLLLDRQPCVPAEVQNRFSRLGCSMTLLQRDALESFSGVPRVEVAFTNLFLHHFNDSALSHLFEEIAPCCDTFVSCEPRRSALALFASRLVPFIGCNDVTRHDAPTSVRAGFQANELTRLWPVSKNWSLEERPAGWCSHLFIARRI
jgi:hypothetical protein